MNDNPVQIAGALFEAVQQARIFPDSKTFPDCRARVDAKSINDAYLRMLRDFVAEHFELPAERPAVALATADSLAAHIDRLWAELERAPDPALPGSSAIALAHPYVVPGGRFREIYYWDSYFTAEGLVASGRLDLAEGMIRNFADLIDRYGYVPNGTRLYYLGRSQPPMFCAMLQLLERCRGFEAVRPFLPQLLREHAFIDGLHFHGRLVGLDFGDHVASLQGVGQAAERRLAAIGKADPRRLARTADDHADAPVPVVDAEG